MRRSSACREIYCRRARAIFRQTIDSQRNQARHQTESSPTDTVTDLRPSKAPWHITTMIMWRRASAWRRLDRSAPPAAPPGQGRRDAAERSLPDLAEAFLQAAGFVNSTWPLLMLWFGPTSRRLKGLLA
jgi:hypothetical protein